jgi:hypothetical protein
MDTPPSTEAIVITGIGPLYPAAMSVQELITAAQSTIVDSTDGPLRPFSRFDPQQFFGKRGFKYLTPATRYALAATQLALQDAGLDDAAYQPDQRGVILGTNFAVHQILDRMDQAILTEGVESLQPMEAPNFSVNIPASQISIKHQFLAFNITLTSMLVAGLEAVILGAQSIRRGRAHLVLAGASEGTPPTPLAAYLGGTVAEGAACMLTLEKLSAARARGAHIYARVGEAALWFAPDVESAETKARLENRIRQHLDRLMPHHQPEVNVSLLEMGFPLCRLANEYLLKCLTERGVRVQEYPITRPSAAEASVAPLLWLAASAATYGEGLIIATSPHGHVAMLRLEPVGKEDTQADQESLAAITVTIDDNRRPA